MMSRKYRSSTSNYKSSEIATPDKRHLRNNIVIMTSFPLQKYIIYPRQLTEPHGTEPHYEGSDFSIPSIHMMKNTIKFMSLWNIPLTKTNIMLISRRKTNKTYNDAAFPKQGYSFYIDKYILFS